MGARQAGFKEVNDAIRGLAAIGPAEETWEFFCECDDLGCRSLVQLTRREFDDRRDTAPDEPILALHHAA